MKSQFERARAYMAKLPPAISGSGGSNATLRAACMLVQFGLCEAEGMALLREYNTGCTPAWTEKELLHKWQSAKSKVTSRAPLTPPPPPVRVTWPVERKTWQPRIHILKNYKPSEIVGEIHRLGGSIHVKDGKLIVRLSADIDNPSWHSLLRDQKGDLVNHLETKLTPSVVHPAPQQRATANA